MNEVQQGSVMMVAPVGAESIPIVQALAADVWRSHYPGILSAAQIEYMLERGYSRDALLRFVTEPGAGLALAGPAQDPCGFAAWYRVDASSLKLDKIYVLPARQRTGAGRALVAYVTVEAKNAGCSVLTLNVNRGNVQAIRAYERYGFVVRGRGDFPIGDGFVMEDFIMERAL
jgi:ribosomal protein S18 acetylase RimI-like enzyme